MNGNAVLHHFTTPTSPGEVTLKAGFGTPKRSDCVKHNVKPETHFTDFTTVKFTVKCLITE